MKDSYTLKGFLLVLFSLCFFNSNAQIQFEEINLNPTNITEFEGVYESSIAYADIDGDNDQDILITGLRPFNQVISKLYTNDGNGSFFEVLNTPFEGVRNGSVAFADVDGDNDQDVLITGANSTGETLSKLYLNDSSGNYTEMLGTPFTGVQGGAVIFTDVDGDNDQDVFITGSNGDALQGSPTTKLYTNDGVGNFTEQIGAFQGDEVRKSSAAFADLDGDFDKDLVLIGEKNGGLRITKVYSNDGSGNFTEIIETPFEALINGTVNFADVDGDDDQDLLLTGESSTSWVSKLYTNDGDFNFVEILDTPFDGVTFGAVDIEDVDGDLDLDVILTGRYGGSNSETMTKLYTNDGSGIFSELSGNPFERVSLGSVAFEDLDGDNDQDLVITGFGRLEEGIAILYTNDGNGNFSDVNQPLILLVPGGAVSFADVDGDGDEDILTAGEIINGAIATAKLYLNDSDGFYTLSAGTPFPAVGSCSVAFTDIDGDNDLDVFITGVIATVITGGGPVTATYLAKLYTNDGYGNFTEVPDTPFLGVVRGSVAFADIDGDNDQDLMITGLNGPTSAQAISKLYANDGYGVFTEVLDTPFVESWNGAIAFGDVDGDNDQDLILTGARDIAQYSAILYENDGNGNFSEVLETPFLGVDDSTADFADVDGDNDLDLLITGRILATNSPPTSELYLNDGVGNFSDPVEHSFEDVGNGAVVFADLDGDQDQDLFIHGQTNLIGFSPSQISKIYSNDGTGSFSEVLGTSSPASGKGIVAFADIDNDSDLDLFFYGLPSILPGDGFFLYRNTSPIPYDCSELNANIGDPCDDGESSTTDDIINSNCECIGASSYDCPDLTANFGEPCDDGNPNTDGETIQADCTCQVNSSLALHFDGSNDQVDIPSDPTTDFGSGDFTVEFWMYLDDTSTEYGGIVSSFNTSSGGWAFHTDFDEISFLVGINASTGGFELVNTSFTPGTWVHVAGVKQGNNIELYLDGVLASTLTSNRAIPNNDIILGRRYTNSVGLYENFKIDELRVWNFALNTDQINDHLNCEITGNEPGLVRYYRFNQGVAEGDNSSETSLISNDLDNPVNGSLSNFALTGPISNFVEGFPFNNCEGLDLTGYPTPPGSGNALSFDGQDDRVVIQNSPEITPGNDSFTISAWFKSAVNTPTSFMSIASMYGYGGSGGGLGGFEADNYSITINADGFPTFVLRDESNNSQTLVDNTFTLDQNWHHIAGVRDVENGNMRLYIDGIEVENQPLIVSSAISPSNNLWIGANEGYNTSSTINYEGEIDEFRYWSAALTQEEIRNHMCQKDLSFHPQLGSLEAYYRFDDGSGSSILKDISGNGNDGTLTNMDPETDWVISGAPIGDQSTQGYGLSSLAFSGGTSFDVENISGSPDGVHIYKVTQEPNDPTPPAGYISLNTTEYYGVHTIGGIDPTYTATYDFSGNSNFSANSSLFLASRDNNAAGVFNDVSGQSFDSGTNTIEAQNQTSSEFILGSDAVECIALNLNIGDPCDDGDPLTPNDMVQEDCTCQGTSDYPTPPGSGDALDFTGVNGGVNFSQSFIQAGAFSIELWVKSTNMGTQSIFSIDGAGGSKVEIALGDITGAFPNELITVAIRNPGDTRLAYLSDDQDQLLDGNWHHLVIASNGIDACEIWLDGISKPITIDTDVGGYAFNLPSVDGMGIGYSVAESGLFFDGEMDEVRIWNAQLSQSEIRNHMCQKDLSSHPQLANLTAYYRFDDGSGSNTLQDISGNGNHGTLTNMDPETDWITSGAPIGDESDHHYTLIGGGSGVFNSFIYNILIGSFQDPAYGAHFYRVNEAPNDLTVPGGFSSIDNSSYLGIFIIDEGNQSFDLHIWGNTNDYPNYQSLKLASRQNNASGAFEYTEGQSLTYNQQPDPTELTMVVNNQTDNEYIFGYNNVDCLALNLNIGDPCDDGDPNTQNEMVQADCQCLDNAAGFDCPELGLNIGDPCDDLDLDTEDDQVLADCVCAGTSIFECPDLSANIGDPCDDGDPNTEGDIVLPDCSCLGTVIPDCPELSLNIGDLCDDGNPDTENDLVLADCECVGTSIFECPDLSANIGDPCDDGDPSTEGDVVFPDCTCSGTLPMSYPSPPGSGDALDFSGVNGGVNFSQSFIQAGAFSIEFWVKSANDITQSLFTVEGTGANKIDIALGEYTGAFQDELITVAIRNGGDTRLAYLAPNRDELFDGNWHHIVIGSNGIDACEIWLDGISKPITIDTESGGYAFNLPGAESISIGYSSASSGLFFDGEMDEVRIWNAQLSQSEIRNHMCQKDLSSHPQLSNLTAYYRFDDGSGSNLLQDISGNGNHGDLSNLDSATDWVTSGAPIGDESDHHYALIPGGGFEVFNSFIYNILIGGFQDPAYGAHFYRVNEAPNDVTVPDGFSSIDNSSYLGIFLVDEGNQSFDLQIWGDTDDFPDYQALKLASRQNNSSGAFEYVEGQSLSYNQEPNPNELTISAFNQVDNEFIFGYSDADCPDLNINIGDPCDDGNPATANDVVQADCSCEGSALPVYPTPVGSGEALDFDGEDDMALLEGITIGSQFSAEAWFKLDAPVEVNQTIIGSCDDPNNNCAGFDYSFFYITILGDGSITTGASYGNASSRRVLLTSQPDLINSGEWIHVAINIDFGANTGAMYINGIEQTVSFDNSGNGTGTFSPSQIGLGGYYTEFPGGNGSLSHFDGLIDEVRIFSSLLSESDIRDHMCQKDLSSHSQIANLQGYYRLDDGIGSLTIQDLSENSNNGSLNNMDPATDWALSGAPVGDMSTQAYGVSNLTLTDLTSFSVTTTSGSPEGINIYKINEPPNDSSVPAGFSSLETSEYYGVYLIGGENPTYTATYDYSANIDLSSSPNEASLRLASRPDNASGAFQNVAIQSLNEDDNTISLTNQTGTEYILGFGQNDCLELGLNIGDPCDDGDPGTENDMVNADCECEGTPVLASISGSIDWSESCGSGELSIKIYEPGTTNLLYEFTSPFDENGGFQIMNIPMGTYDVFIKPNGHLRKGFTGIELTVGVNVLDAGSFVGGDVNNDNVVNIIDVSFMNSAFGSTSGDINFNPLCDFNCDSNVNIIDVSILNGTFGLVGDTP